MKTVTTTIYLVIAGLVLLAIGGTILLAPHTLHSSNGISLGSDPNLLSEIRAPGGLLICSGIIILMGVVRQQVKPSALKLSVLVYGAIGASRLISIGIDGMPSTPIVGAALFELTVALVGVFILFQVEWRRQRQTWRAENLATRRQREAGLFASVKPD